MQKELLNKGEGVYEIDATLEKEAWTAAREKALKKLIKNVQIKGFRKGQAPESMAKNYVDPNKLINEAINIALPSMYDEAIKEFKLVPFTQPDVEVTDLTDEALKVKFTITVYPEVKLGQYKDIHLEYAEPKVSAKEVKESIDKLLADNAELVLSNEPAKLGDTVVRLSATAHSYYDYHSDKTDDIISASVQKTVQMVLPIYAGFGTSVDGVKIVQNKLSVRTSAAGTYTKTCQADGQNFYILVPRTFTTLTSFTMGGAPFVMETSDITLGDYEYKQYKSGSVYNTGATVKIKAS